MRRWMTHDLRRKDLDSRYLNSRYNKGGCRGCHGRGSEPCASGRDGVGPGQEVCGRGHQFASINAECRAAERDAGELLGI